MATDHSVEAALEAMEAQLDANELVLLECLRTLQSSEETAEKRVELLRQSCALMCEEVSARFKHSGCEDLVQACIPMEAGAVLPFGANSQELSELVTVLVPETPSSVQVQMHQEEREGTIAPKRVWTEEEKERFEAVVEGNSGKDIPRTELLSLLQKQFPDLKKTQINSHLQVYEKKKRKRMKKAKK